MPHEVIKDDQLKLILVTYTEFFDTSERTVAMHQVIEYLNQNPDYGVLIDKSSGEETSTDDEKLEFGEFMTSYYKQFPKTRIAVLGNTAADSDLIVASSYAHGLENICLFVNKKDAIDWLNNRQVR